MTAKTKSPCTCNRFGIVCGGDTWNVFAPGHDARMKGVLQRAHRAGEKVVLDGRAMHARTAVRKVAPALERFLDAPVAETEIPEAA